MRKKKGPAHGEAPRVADPASKPIFPEHTYQPTAAQARMSSVAPIFRARPDRNAEARIQAAIVEWVRTVARDLIVYHVPNGGWRSKSEAARLKWQGVLAGVPDLCLIALHGRAFFMEVKAPGGYLSPEQRAFADRCTALRVPFAVVRSIDDARQAFEVWGIPTREACP